MIFRGWLVPIWSILLFSNHVFSQDGFDQKESIRNKQRVNYVFNFTDYITWEDIGETFDIAVLGVSESGLIEEFKMASKSRKLKERKITIKHYSTVNDIQDAEILYVHQRQGFDLTSVLPKMYENHTLLVTENYGYDESMINFIEFGGEFHFTVSTNRIHNAGLLVAPRLLSFSITQQGDWEVVFNRLKEEEQLVETQSAELYRLKNLISEQQELLNSLKARVIAQREELGDQNVAIKNSIKLLDEQSAEISAQKRELEILQRQVVSSNHEKVLLSESLKVQNREYEERQNQIGQQTELISKQEINIQRQKDSLKQQQEQLNSQFDRIERQGYLIFIFVSLFLLIVLLAFFVRREYKRKRRSEYRVKLQNERLVALNESLDSFVYRVSHDLKAPVVNVQNMVNMLEEYNGDREMTEKIISNLNLSAKRLETTITDLLELSRIERAQEDHELVELNELIFNLISEYNDRITEVGGKADLNLSKAIQCHVSKVELESIFQNLLTNSIKYRSPERDLLIQISTFQQKDSVTIEYADNGKGIDLEKFEGKLFEMFQRFTNDNSIPGTGVGMYIIKKLVEKNNGKVTISSELNQGLKYKIVFPKK